MPGVHAAHRYADDGAQMRNPEHLGHQPMLKIDHVAVTVARKCRPQSVTRLARPTVADSIGQDHEISGGIEGRARRK